jgi:hypothetical protein
MIGAATVGGAALGLLGGGTVPMLVGGTAAAAAATGVTLLMARNDPGENGGIVPPFIDV